MPLLIAGLLALSAALIVLYPLLGLGAEAAPQSAPAQVADAAERERLARQALREVEFDYTLGNLEAEDYTELRERYETRAIAALKTRYQREQELDALIEQRLDALRQSSDALPIAPQLQTAAKAKAPPVVATGKTRQPRSATMETRPSMPNTTRFSTAP